ncbi:hypothetical protein SPRG_03396 [Saprolegnia parasitica CBS 223.65]|uniref:COMM domain-containing protein n=1 Tax=Saprolegnia parasitica (strain CBS 223.65) TaxID=695850 RepID=A0A067CND6_SAPPC|nr:hypothetical protein SPRG_03396 [Saprolegnia parasitica CBS 223.65]KDO32179.1 hypothetical protein SPRG_03396 [Saprolegnia parasitica CBS 223.65]|eukprot:XP_012197360.1 hypothetical protein SPRG_03396 [Saprolegnia parasitica CBS 223.65]
MPVSSALQALVAAHLVGIAPILAHLTNDLRDNAQRTTELSQSQPTKNALLVLATMAPDAIPAFTEAWLSALPAAIDTTLHMFYPIVVWMGTQLGPFYGSAPARLTTECLARLRTARAPVSVEPAHEMADIAIDPEHCAECLEVAGFLHDGTRAHLDLKQSSWRLCSIVLACVTAHSDRLTMVKLGDANTKGILKLPPPAGVSLAEYTTTQNDLAHIDRCIATLVDATQRATKRPRHY